MGHYSGEITVYAIGVILVLVLFRAVYQVLRAPTSHIPGPWYSKWTSVILEFHWLSGSRSYYVHALHRQYGPVVRIGPNEIDITDIEAVKVIYGIKRPFLKSQFYRRLATPGQESLFTTVNADFHREHRRLLAGPMSESSLKSTIPQIDALLKLAIQNMDGEMKSRGSADVFKWWLFMTTDIIGELTFGDSFRMLELGHKNDYARELEQIGRLGAIRASFPSIVNISSIIPLPIFKRALKHDMDMRRYAIDSLERYRRLKEADPSLVQQTLFTNLFKAEEEKTIRFNEIRDQGQSYIAAGSSTTANSLTYLTWSVCRHAETRAKLVKELQTLPPGFTEAQLRDLPFLNQVVNETLRLYTAAPSALPRVVPPGGVELAGYWFGEGTVVCTQAFSMHRDPLIFPEPDKFIPSRWASPTKAMKDAFMPFGRGPRVCLGLYLAQIEIRLATARFFLAFPAARMSSLEGMSDSDMKPKIYVLLAPSGGRCLVQAT